MRCHVEDVCRRMLIFSRKGLKDRGKRTRCPRQPIVDMDVDCRRPRHDKNYSSLFVENSHPETRHQGVMFRSPRAFVGSTATLRYEPCTQFINVSQRTLHIYWQFSAMSHAIHKIVSKRRCQSYFISRRSPHHGKSKNRDL